MSKLLIILLLALVLSTSPAWAHGVEKILNQDVNNYTLGLSYDQFEMDLGGAVPIGFNISTKGGGSEVDFSHVFVKITPVVGDEAIFSAPIKKSDLGETTLSYKFPNSGGYKISTSFRRGTDTLAEGEFKITVPEIKKPTEPSNNFPLTKESALVGLGGLILGYGLSLALKKK